MSFIKNNLYYKSPQEQAKFTGYTQAAAGISSLLPEESNPYAFDKFASLKGAAQGAQLGANFGPVGALAGAVIGGLGAGISELIQDRNALKNTQTSFDTINYDENGQPIYQGEQLTQGLNNLDQIRASGNPLDVFNRKLRRNTANKLSQGITQAQQRFNDANITYSRNLLARQQYEDEMKKNNIYNFPMQLV